MVVFALHGTVWVLLFLEILCDLFLRRRPGVALSNAGLYVRTELLRWAFLTGDFLRLRSSESERTERTYARWQRLRPAKRSAGHRQRRWGSPFEASKSGFPISRINPSSRLNRHPPLLRWWLLRATREAKSYPQSILRPNVGDGHRSTNE